MLNMVLGKLYLLPVIFLSLSVHEYFHGLAAYKLGDNTAKLSGRLTINPFAHIDLLGTLAMLFFGFGWAKPVPVNYSNLKHKRLGPILVALAGPLSNILLAFVSALLLIGLMVGGVISGGFFAEYLSMAIIMNITLAVFNLIPLPPLDGSKVVLSLLPYKLQYKVYRYEPYIQVFLLFLLYMGRLDSVINYFSSLMLSGLTNAAVAIIILFK